MRGKCATKLADSLNRARGICHLASFTYLCHSTGVDLLQKQDLGTSYTGSYIGLRQERERKHESYSLRIGNSARPILPSLLQTVRFAPPNWLSLRLAQGSGFTHINDAFGWLYIPNILEISMCSARICTNSFLAFYQK